MDMFTSSGPAGAGAAYASLALVHALIDRMEAVGILNRKDVRVISQHAIDSIPQGESAALNDALYILESTTTQYRK